MKTKRHNKYLFSFEDPRKHEVNNKEYSFWISGLLHRYRVEISSTNDTGKFTFFKDFYQESLDINERIMKRICDLITSEERENVILGKEVLLKLINVEEDEFIQKGLKRLEG